jgi:hypothetical protein
MTGAGIVAYGLMAFSLGVRHLNIVDHRAHGHGEPEAEAEPEMIVAE